MKILRFFLISVLSIQLISCATIINGSTEKVQVFSNVSETSVYIDNVYIGTAGPDASLEVTIPKRGRIEFIGKKVSCEDGSSVVRKSIDPTTFLGILIDGGLISILFVDIIGTNAFVHASEQSYFLELECQS